MRQFSCEYVRSKLNSIDCIVCLESAADYLGLTNGGFRDKITVYSLEDIKDEEIQAHIVDTFENINYTTERGIMCTTVEQTLHDLLLNSNEIDDQIILESLSNYYYTNNESFNSLLGALNTESLDKLQQYKEDAIMYYSE